MKQKGFTLIELLAVIGIIAFIGTTLVIILSITFRGSKKSDTLVILRQNGNAALSQISRSIRYAKTVSDPVSCVPSVTTSEVTIIAPDDNPTIYACTNGISSNSASLIDTNNVKVTNCSFVCTQQTSYDPPSVTVKFTLEPKNSTALVETNASIPFQTSVTLRNYNP